MITMISVSSKELWKTTLLMNKKNSSRPHK